MGGSRRPFGMFLRVPLLVLRGRRVRCRLVVRCIGIGRVCRLRWLRLGRLLRGRRCGNVGCRRDRWFPRLVRCRRRGYSVLVVCEWVVFRFWWKVIDTTESGDRSALGSTVGTAFGSVVRRSIWCNGLSGSVTVSGPRVAAVAGGRTTM